MGVEDVLEGCGAISVLVEWVDGAGDGAGWAEKRWFGIWGGSGREEVRGGQVVRGDFLTISSCLLGFLVLLHGLKLKRYGPWTSM